ncbi:MAG: hypothetical protein WC149_10300 [Arcobacteraceae bacterium]
MKLLICWISQVPNVIWSAIIASLLTFLGVMWTNKGNERRQISLLDHEKEKFQSEQKLALKKEVFLNLASSFADVLGIIPNLMNLNFSEKDIKEQMGNHSGIVAKSYLVAKENSVAEILNYSSEVAETLLNLMKDRIILIDHKNAIEIYQSMIDSANTEKNRILSMMKEFNLQGRNDKVIFDYLDNSYKFQEDIIKSTMKSIEEQELLLKPLHVNYSKKCIQEHCRLVSLLPPMTIALRNELNNNSDSEVFINALSVNVSRTNAAFGKLLE